MKCKLLRDELITHPDLKGWDDMHALAGEFHRGEISKDEFNARSRIAAKAGTVIDHPLAYLLVANGRAEPVDKECFDRANQVMPDPGYGDFSTRLTLASEAADRVDTAQVTGDPQFDASPEQVEAMKEARAQRIAKAG